MKTLFSIILACTLQHTYAQMQRVDSVYNILIQAARPSIQAWVANTAAKYKSKEATESSIKATEDFKTLGNFTSTDIDALCFLVMVQVAKNNERVSKNVAPILKNKKIETVNIKTAPANEMSEEMQLKLQTAMDKRGKAETMLSNIMKKGSDTVNQIVANLK
jgi:hypothetical protein